MLTEDDVAFIRANRTEIKQHRTESVTAEYTDGSTGPLNVIWKEPPSPNGTEARGLGEYTILSNDYAVTLDDSVAVDTLRGLQRGSGRYILTDIDERGLGGLNRYECRAMLILTTGQTITVTRGATEDGWGAPTPILPPVTMAAYVSEEMRTVTNQLGEEAVCELRIVLEGLADIDYRDKVRYVNELGTVTERKPVRVAIKRRADGTPLVTEVFV
ncbi:hypothetical protein KQR54_18330 [Mycobacterium gordonae]|nr:hypothetical protein [Mycobacterium gordonae]